MTEPEGPLRRDRREEAEDAPEIVAESLETASPELRADLAQPQASARIAGDTRRPLTRFPTDSVDIFTPAEGGTPQVPADTPAPWPEDQSTIARRRLAPWALAMAIVALLVSFFVGWGIPLALVAVIAAIVALRRSIENRFIAGWALGLGLLATVLSAGWLIWTVAALERMG